MGQTCVKSCGLGIWVPEYDQTSISIYVNFFCQALLLYKRILDQLFKSVCQSELEHKSTGWLARIFLFQLPETKIQSWQSLATTCRQSPTLIFNCYKITKLLTPL